MRSGGILLSALLLTVPMTAQESAPKPKQTVVYGAEPQNIPAGKKTMVELHFTVLPGYHVNSHTPKSDFLIPTAIKPQPAAGVTTSEAEYPAGQEFSFSFSPDEKLDVYTGQFVVKLPVVATAGEHTVSAVLKYQACDRAACYPPKSLPIEIPFTAK